MKNSPKIVSISVAVTTIIVAFYSITPYIGVPAQIIILLFLLIPFIMIWMVITILKRGVSSSKTFEDHWYEDFDQNQ